MRFAIVGFALLFAAPALADYGDDAPKVHKKCPTLQCFCNDATTTTDCLDADACAKFCDDHGGPVKMHKRRRHGTGKAQDARNVDEDDKF